MFSPLPPSYVRRVTGNREYVCVVCLPPFEIFLLPRFAPLLFNGNLFLVSPFPLF